MSHAVETGKATSAALVHPPGRRCPPSRGRGRAIPRGASAQAGARDDAVDLAAQRQRSRTPRARRGRRSRAARAARTAARGRVRDPATVRASATNVPVPSSPDCSISTSLRTLAGESTQTPGYVVNGSCAAVAAKRIVTSPAPTATCRRSPALERRRRPDQEQGDDVEQVAVAYDRVAEADAERRRLEREGSDRHQRERRERMRSLLAWRTSVASIQPPPRISGTSPQPIATASRCRPADDQTPEGSRDPSSTVTA